MTCECAAFVQKRRIKKRFDDTPARITVSRGVQTQKPPRTPTQKPPRTPTGFRANRVIRVITPDANGVVKGTVNAGVYERFVFERTTTPTASFRIQVTSDRLEDLVFILGTKRVASQTALPGERTYVLTPRLLERTVRVPNQFRFVRVLTNEGADITYNATMSIVPPPKRYALVIGISDYQSSAVNDLSFCDEDAARFRELLAKQGYDVTLLGDGKSRYIVKNANGTTTEYVPDGIATEENVRTQLRRLADLARVGDKVVFTCSSHGVRAFQGLESILAVDYGKNLPGAKYNGAYTDREFAEDVRAIAKKRARFIGIFDFCHAGGVADEVVAVNPRFVTALSTSSGSGYGYDMPKYQHGAWTYHLVQALEAKKIRTLNHWFNEAVREYPYKDNDLPNIKGFAKDFL